MTTELMTPSYAEQIMLDAQAGYFPEADDLATLARSYLRALECIAATKQNGLSEDEANWVPKALRRLRRLYRDDYAEQEHQEYLEEVERR